MTAFAFLIPLIFVIFILIFFREKVVWWEYLILVIPSMLISTLMYFGMISSNTSDVEYFGDYVTEIVYYEDWDEYIHKTCSYTTTDSKGNSTTHTYDCSYVDYHPEEYKQKLSNGNEYSIDKTEYLRLFSMWKTPNIFVDLDRDYHNNDGDSYVKSFDNNILHSKTRTVSHNYTNKIKGSKSVFGFTNISKKEAVKLGLFEYPELYEQSKTTWSFDNDANQSPFLGYKPTKEELIKWQWINGYYGVKNQFRTYNLVFYNKPLSIVQEQKSYWEGGNKNEMIVCICLDSITKNIQWIDVFSWSDKPTYEVNLRSYFNNKTKINFLEFANWTENSIPKYWKRKEFKDFDYIDVQLTDTQITWLFIIIFIFNLGMSIFIVLNNENN